MSKNFLGPFCVSFPAGDVKHVKLPVLNVPMKAIIIPQRVNGVVGSGGTGGMPSNASIPIPSNTAGQTITVSNGSNFFYAMGAHYSVHTHAFTPEPESMEPELPDTILYSVNEKQEMIKLTFKPEADITHIESLQLMLLFKAYDEFYDENKFNPLMYVKSRNLERHFKFEDVDDHS